MDQYKYLVVSLILYMVLPSSVGERSTWENTVYNNVGSNLSHLISKNILQMAHDIGAYIIPESTEKTQVFSPLSIYGALSMLLLGSCKDTFRQLMQVMHYADHSNIDLGKNPWIIHKEFGNLLRSLDRDQFNDEHRIRVANRLFVQRGFSIRPDYFDATRDVYRSNTTNLDFIGNGYDATNYINNWINQETEGKIPKMLSDTLSPETKVVVASALYFKAMWEKTFFEGGTTKRQFYPNGLDNPSIMVDMMAQGGTFPFYNSIEYDCRIIGLPYKRNLSTMYIILPNNSSRTRLRELQQMLSADSIAEMISKMEMKTAVMLFPKLHISNEFNLKKIFQNLGLYRLFDRSYCDLSLISDGQEIYIPQQSIEPWTGYESDQRTQPYNSILNMPNLEDVLIFSRIGEDSDSNTTEPSMPMNKTETRTKRNVSALKNLDKLREELISRSDNPGLFAEEIVHKVDLTVNEKGTDGGAATITYLYRTGTDVVFRVETPFMFFIQHERTKLPLFYGTVFEPTNF